MGFVGQTLIKLKSSFIRGFLQLPFDALLGGITNANMLVATQWPLKCTPDLPGSMWSGSSLDLSALWLARVYVCVCVCVCVGGGGGGGGGDVEGGGGGGGGGEVGWVGGGGGGGGGGI